MNTREGGITEYLSRDHSRLHALLERATSSGQFDADAYGEFRVGLLRHIGIEEKLLFPAVKRAREGEALERAFDLRIDHAALTSLLVPTPDAALCAEILSILTPHDAKEEDPGGVYAECESLLSADESADLAARAQGYGAVPVVKHYDGPGVHRTAASALASAQRMRRSR